DREIDRASGMALAAARICTSRVCPTSGVLMPALIFPISASSSETALRAEADDLVFPSAPMIVYKKVHPAACKTGPPIRPYRPGQALRRRGRKRLRRT